MRGIEDIYVQAFSPRPGPNIGSKIVVKLFGAQQRVRAAGQKGAETGLAVL
jgi:hypothetical protein